jgi:hypothetical protein
VNTEAASCVSDEHSCLSSSCNNEGHPRSLSRSPRLLARLRARSASFCFSARLSAQGSRDTQEGRRLSGLSPKSQGSRNGRWNGNGQDKYSEEEASTGEEEEGPGRWGENDEEDEVSSATSSGSSIFDEEPVVSGKALRRQGKAARSRQMALDFVLREVVHNGGMMELYKLGALLNQKHPEMKKKVGKLRAFIEKHRQHLRVIRSQDANGSPDDFVMLTEQAVRRAYASSNGGRVYTGNRAGDFGDGSWRVGLEDGGGVRGGSQGSRSTIARGRRKRTKSKTGWESSPLSKLHGKSRKEGDPCNYQWDERSSSETTTIKRGKDGRRGGGGGGGGTSWRATRRGLQRALGTNPDSFDLSSESDLPIGVL